MFDDAKSLEALASSLRQIALRSQDAEAYHLQFPQEGQFVVELSSCNAANDILSVGILEKIAIETDVSVDGWDVELEGKPQPTGAVYLVRTLDDEVCRWTGPSFFGLPEEIVKAAFARRDLIASVSDDDHPDVASSLPSFR